MEVVICIKGVIAATRTQIRSNKSAPQNCFLSHADKSCFKASIIMNRYGATEAFHKKSPVNPTRKKGNSIKIPLAHQYKKFNRLSLYNKNNTSQKIKDKTITDFQFETIHKLTEAPPKFLSLPLSATSNLP